jgi:hypothetical protein
MIFEYAIAILVALGLIFAGIIGLTVIYLVFAEWHFIYKKWQVRKNGTTE